MVSKPSGNLVKDALFGARSTGQKFILEGRGENVKKKQIEEARRRVNDTKEEHKKAQRELSKLLEDK